MRIPWAVLLAVFVSGCAKAASPVAELAFMAAEQRGAPATGATAVDRTLAYEHHVTVELNESALSDRLDALRKACVDDAKRACTLLDVSRQDTRGTITGRIRVRVPPSGVEPMIAVASAGGKVVSR